jgi:hypothetical protein
MMNLEDKIIAYLDGTLDETSRAELLHTLSVSPEKRKLLEEHIKLREIISLGHKPASVPLMTERKLADRIPVLMQELPYLAEKSNRIAPFIGVNSTSYFTLLGRQVSSFFTSRFAPALSVGALLLVGGMTWYMSSLNDPAQVAAPKDQIVQQQHNAQSSNDEASRSSNNSILNNRSSAASTLEVAGGDESQNLSNRVQPGSSIKYSSPSKKTSQVKRGSNPVTVESQSGSSDRLVDNNSDSHSSNVVNNDNVNSAATNESTVSDKSNVIESSQTEQKNAIKDPEQSLPPLPMPSQEKTVTGRFSVQAGAENGFMTVRPNQKTQSYETGSGGTFPNLGVGYELNNRFAIGLEVGKSVLSQQKEDYEVESLMANPGPAGSLVTVNERITYSAAIVDVSALWSQVSLRYTVNPESLVRIELTGGAGAAFHEGLSPMVSLGLGGTYDLTQSIAFTAGLSARAAWMEGIPNPGPSQETGPAKAVAVVSHRAEISDYVLSSSIAGRAGIRFTF